MAKRRKTPEDDFERLAERMYSQRFAGQISDKETFDNAWNSYFKGEHPKASLKKRVFETLVDKYDVSPERVSPERKELRKAVKKVKKEKISRAKPDEFEFIGRQRGRVAYARRIEIIFMGKTAVRFIDAKGHYVSVRREP
jgi:hypothetical protein